MPTGLTSLRHRIVGFEQIFCVYSFCGSYPRNVVQVSLLLTLSRFSTLVYCFVFSPFDFEYLITFWEAALCKKLTQTVKQVGSSFAL